MTLYPASLPIDDISLIISDIRGGTLGTDQPKFAKAVWELTGYALKSTIGEPNGAPLALTLIPGANLTSHDVAGHLDRLVATSPLAVNFESILAQIPWASIAQWGLTILLSKMKA